MSVLHGFWVSYELTLMPVGVGWRHFAGGVQLCYLFWRQIPSYGGQILAELFFVAGADDYVSYCGPLQKPVQADLRNRLAGFFGYFVQRVYDFIKIFVRDRRALLGGAVQPADFWQWMASTDFSGKPAPP